MQSSAIATTRGDASGMLRLIVTHLASQLHQLYGLLLHQYDIMACLLGVLQYFAYLFTQFCWLSTCRHPSTVFHSSSNGTSRSSVSYSKRDTYVKLGSNACS